MQLDENRAICCDDANEKAGLTGNGYEGADEDLIDRRYGARDIYSWGD